MNTEKIEQLLEKYFEGKTSLDEEKQLRDFFRSAEVPGHMEAYAAQFRSYDELQAERLSGDVDPFAKISFGEEKEPLSFANKKVAWTLRVAAGLILLLIGFSAGLLINRQGPVSGQQVAALQKEVQQMKSALVYGSYREASASERISAVNLSARIPAQSKELDGEITQILIYTLNNDENSNVRQAAAEALFRFRGDRYIRKALVNSLPQQPDPLMQITLINMLVKLKETGAINEMQKMLMDSETREIVKKRLKTGIAELKT